MSIIPSFLFYLPPSPPPFPPPPAQLFPLSAISNVILSVGLQKIRQKQDWSWHTLPVPCILTFVLSLFCYVMFYLFLLFVSADSHLLNSFNSLYNTVCSYFFTFRQRVNSTYTECQAFSPVVRIASPLPSPANECYPLPLVPGGRGTLAGGGGGEGSQFGRRDRHSGPLGI